MTNDKKKEIKYFSMFSGVGGFELGFKRANDLPETSRGESRRDEENSSNSKQIRLASKQFTCVGFSEIDKYSIQTYQKNFPDHINFGDATELKPEKLPDFDMLCGGFPCQSFSIAGKRRGFKDTRGTMFFEIARVLKVKRPKFILLENVKGLLNHNKGETFKVILQTLDELGYEIQWMVLNSKFFGVPQNRERVFIIGSLRGEPRPEILPFREISETIDEPAVSHTLPSSYHKITRGTTMINEIKITSVAIRNKNRSKHQNNEGENYGDYEKDYQLEEQKEGVSYTVKGATQEFMAKQGTQIRRLTPIECERLQGFPDGWTAEVSDTQRYKQMGNAVTVNVVQAIANKLTHK